MSREFEEFINDNVRLQFFSPGELLFKGASHYKRGSKSFGLNTDPPRELWDNILPTIKVLDRFRARLDGPIRIISAYRSPPYNRSIDGALRSQHTEFAAIDFTSPRGRPVLWAQELKEMRHDGDFSGGIGLYRTFVHVDTRGWNADW
jgi:Peptidase M15